MLDRPPRSRDRRAAPKRAAGPAHFNIGAAVLDRWAAADPDRPAVVELVAGRLAVHGFGALKARSDRLALALRRLGGEAQEILPLGEAVARLSREAMPPDLARAAARDA